MNLDAALPSREWVTLCEAATAIAFGTAETANAYQAKREAYRAKSQENYAMRARALAPIVRSMGYDYIEDLLNAVDLETALPQQFIEFEQWNAARIDLEAKIVETFFSSIKTLVEEGAAGRISFRGVYGGSGRDEPIQTYDLTDLIQSPDWAVGDFLHCRDRDGRWCFVKLKRADIIVSFQTAEISICGLNSTKSLLNSNVGDTHPSQRPAITGARRKKAVAFLAKEFRERAARGENLNRETAHALVRSFDSGIGPRPFLGIWPDAREAAGLPRKALSGAPKRGRS